MTEVNQSKSSFFALTLAALGVVYGDIGTSPLYAMRVALEGVSINSEHILGVLSLIFWSLILSISIKYLYILFRADNAGEGGILALLALTKPFQMESIGILGLVGIAGAGLMLGDGMLTPAISILSAIEGIHVIVPSLSSWVIPLTCGILVLLFTLQSLGTTRIGFLFGPIIFMWFVVIAVLGFLHVIQNPVVLLAINPCIGLHFLFQMGLQGYLLLGGVFLVLTGGEALYADLGHFGKTPIRTGWFGLVFPALILNYFGQGAYLLNHPEAIDNPFYGLAPSWFLWPLLILATAATLIASQAVISAIFSLTKQAILLGFFPHIPIIQTSESERGQIYIPKMNFILAIGTFVLIALFQNSNAMTHAYGIAVNFVMLLSLILVTRVAIVKWCWNPFQVILLVVVFGTFDCSFLGANLMKISTGGWVPISVALVSGFIMYTWYKGRRYLQQTYHLKKDDLRGLLTQLDNEHLISVPDSTAVFITDIYDESCGTFLQFLTLSRMIPAHIVLLNCSVENVPYISSVKRVELNQLKLGIYTLTLHYGFMEIISIPQALYVANDRGLLPFILDVEKITYFIDIPKVIPSYKNPILWFWGQEQLFSFLVKNYSANLNIQFYQLPFNQTVAIGTYYLL